MTFRADLRHQHSRMHCDLLRSYGVVVPWYHKDLAAISLYMEPGPAEVAQGDGTGLTAEETARTFICPSQAGLLAEIVTRALTSNAVTLTFRRAHGFLAGQRIRVALDTADATFDGEQLVATVPSTTTLTYAKTAANVASASRHGWATGFFNVGDKLTFESAPWQIERIRNPDGIGALWELDAIRDQAVKIGSVN